MAVYRAAPVRGGDAFTEATSKAGAGCACAPVAVIASTAEASVNAFIAPEYTSAGTSHRTPPGLTSSLY